jgi:uncharacterized protein (TIGR00255 family)
MTGYGRGTADSAGWRATVDVRAVNHRFLDLKLRGAPLPPAVEDAVAGQVRAVVARGAVVVAVHLVDGREAAPAIDRVAARRAYLSLRALADDLVVPPPDLALILAQPGVHSGGGLASAASDDAAAAAIGAAVGAATGAALAQLLAMRQAEGAALARELEGRLDELAALRERIAGHAAAGPAAAAARLRERLRKLLADEGAAVDPGRLAQEVALLADRADISEELVRLESHLAQARAFVRAADQGGVGRRLDFLIQELGRELNTMGSKSVLAELSAAVVEGKAVLEKLREQVQNVE